MSKPIADVQVTGTATSVNVDRDPDGGAVIVAYVQQKDGTVGRVWLRLPADATDHVRRRLNV
jgi:hypothetical protein